MKGREHRNRGNVLPITEVTTTMQRLKEESQFDNNSANNETIEPNIAL